MEQEQAFREMIQRYQRELGEMQKKAQERARAPLRRPPEPLPGEDAAPVPAPEDFEQEFAPPPAEPPRRRRFPAPEWAEDAPDGDG